ncbi:MAG: helix-turn-helix domain-containing protein [Pseudoxanthomonas sp.]
MRHGFGSHVAGTFRVAEAGHSVTAPTAQVRQARVESRRSGPYGNDAPLLSGQSRPNVRRTSWEDPRHGQDGYRRRSRRRRTRQDLLAAFLSLALTRSYHEIKVADVLSRSGVGRSTFYEHFRNKDELLAASFESPFRILASLTGTEADVHQAQAILEHFRQNRELARSLFQGSALRVVRRTLAMHVEAAIERDPCSRLRLPLRLAACSLADGMFSPINAWLSGEAKCSARELALALQLSATASAHALQAGNPSSHEQEAEP